MRQDTAYTDDERVYEGGSQISLSSIREMVGLAPAEPSDKELPANEGSGNADADALVDAEDFEEEGPTQRKLWQRPVPKMVAIALPVGFVSLILGFFLVNVTKIRLTKDGAEEVRPVEVAATDPTALKDEEIARLKTANALGNQSTVLNSQEARRTEIRPMPQESSAAPSRPDPTQRESQGLPRRPATTVASDSVRSRPVPVSRPAYQPTPPRSPAPVRSTVSYTPPRPTAPSTASMSRASTPVSTAPNSSSETSTSDTDPFEQWQRLASVGSYGEIEAEVSEEQQVSADEEAILTASAEQSTTIPVMVNSTTDISAMLVSDQSAVKEFEKGEESSFETAQVVSYEEGVEFIMGSPTENEPEARYITEIVPGVKAEGEIIAPVAWAGDVDGTVGAIELSEDLISNGTVIMPAGTQLIVSVRSMSASGMMDLQVNSIVLPWSGYEQMQIPTEAISIQGGDGQVLIAKDVSGREGELRQLDRNQALLGALGQIGAVLNRPDSQSTSVGAGGAYSTSDYGSPSIIGAILEGGANTMIASQQARNQDRAERLDDLPSVWVLESGTDIEVFVNQPVSWE